MRHYERNPCNATVVNAASRLSLGCIHTLREYLQTDLLRPHLHHHPLHHGLHLCRLSCHRYQRTERVERMEEEMIASCDARVSRLAEGMRGQGMSFFGV